MLALPARSAAAGLHANPTWPQPGPCTEMSEVAFPYLGELLSLLAALVWAVSVVLFRLSGRKLPPLSLNFFSRGSVEGPL